MARAVVSRVRGSTALTEDAGHRHPVHHLGDALRAVRVFVVTAFRVVVMGQDGAARD
ncbi:hypothetical protein [Streptomyces sp. NPDC001070]